MSGYRPPYTHGEERKILRYIIDNQAHYRLRGDAFWKEVEEAKIVDRTWRSLKEHFRKKVIHKLHLPVYELTESEQQDLKTAYATTENVRRHRRPSSSDSDSDDKVRETSSNKGKKASDKPEQNRPVRSRTPDFFTMKFSDSDDD